VETGHVRRRSRLLLVDHELERSREIRLHEQLALARWTARDRKMAALTASDGSRLVLCDVVGHHRCLVNPLARRTGWRARERHQLMVP
jgi:hypothetical protein